MYDLEKFVSVGKRSTQPKVSISKKCSLIFNNSACEKYSYFLLDHNYIECFYSSKEHLIVLLFHKEETDSSLKISKTKSGRCVIALKSFFTHFKINIDTVVGDHLVTIEDIYEGTHGMVIKL